MNFLDLIKSNGYITVSKELAKEIGLNETIILSELISQYEYFKKNGQLKDNKWFYCTIEKMEEQTTLNRYYQNKAIDNLKELGLLEVERKGLPARRYFKIVENEIIKLFLDKKSEEPRHLQNENISQTGMKQSYKQESNSVTNINNNNNNNNKTEEEDAREIPEKISTKFEQVFNRKMSVELYNKLIKIYSDPQILLKALQVAEEQADKPKYLLVILKDWKKENMTSVSEINSYLEKRDKNNSKKSRRSSPSNKKEHDKLHNIEELKAKGWN